MVRCCMCVAVVFVCGLCKVVSVFLFVVHCVTLSGVGVVCWYLFRDCV